MKLFIPILDNGQGDIKADFLFDFFRATSGREIQLARFSDSHPGRGRNVVAASFLRSDCTHLLFIDGDIGFVPADMDRMFQNPELLIVGGIYPLKCATETKLCLQTLPDHQPTETGGFLEVARTGTGFLRIAREVFERMKQPGRPAHQPSTISHQLKYAQRYTNHGGHDEWDFFQSGVINGEWLSEDWFFCDRARALGIPVLVDTNIQLWHEGSIKYPIQQQARRLDLCPPDMVYHIERLWTGGSDQKGEYFIPLDPPPATVLDLGANIGGFTEWACETWPNASVAAYEPHPDNATLYRLNTRHRSKRVSFYNAGVRAEAGSFVLRALSNCGEFSFHHEEGEGVTVHCEPAATIPSAEFVKIDTEGSELEILLGLDLSATRAIALEYHSSDDFHDIPTVLATRGFYVFDHEPIADGRGILKFIRNPETD